MYRLYPEEFFEHPNFNEALEIYQSYARQTGGALYGADFNLPGNAIARSIGVRLTG